MTGFRSFDNKTCKTVLGLLEVGYLKLRKRITVIKFGVNDGGRDSRSCFGIEVTADTAEFTNIIIADLAGFGNR